VVQRSYYIDSRLSTLIDDHIMRPGGSSSVAWNHLDVAERRGVVPKPGTLGHMIMHWGRQRDMAKVERLYQVAQVLLSRMQAEQWKRTSWAYIENSMIVALAHLDALDRAYIHRDRIIASGGVPNVDAYGALLLHVSETTDDASNAMALWNEAVSRGVMPSIYMYNNIISKLAKARRTDECMQMFQELQTRGLRPTSVTYGTIISALCRVGNEQGAEKYFQEMTQQPSYKPRIPPYNTLMQFFTYTKPDRERALYYYDLLQQAKVQPSAHTYKILMDVYGTIEPVDERAMLEIFALVTSSSPPLVQGVHWASLINMYGCMKKDLDKAMEIFESIASHPSTVNAKQRLPDATIFESLINVIVTLHRYDMIDDFLHRLQSSGVRPTAYIVNLIIKGYAAAGDLERARAYFEALQDPPQGVAAPHNRAAHDNDVEGAVASPHVPVYREPSTWEEMIRAELRSGNRDRALELITRVQSRQYPVGVYNRISSALLQHDSKESDVSSPTTSVSKTDSFDSDSYDTKSSQTSI